MLRDFSAIETRDQTKNRAACLDSAAERPFTVKGNWSSLSLYLSFSVALFARKSASPCDRAMKCQPPTQANLVQQKATLHLPRRGPMPPPRRAFDRSSPGVGSDGGVEPCYDLTRQARACLRSENLQQSGRLNVPC